MLLLDFEEKQKEEVEGPQGLTVGIPIPQRDLSVMPDEIPFQAGSVLRQKNEIEVKYGSSPRQSKLSPDRSLCPPSSVAPSDAARLTPTLEKYCASDILELTGEMPEDFVDENGEDIRECDRHKQFQNNSCEQSSLVGHDLSEGDLKQQNMLLDAGSLLFQRSFSYRENSQRKPFRMPPFFSRSASLRSRWSSDIAKDDNSVVVSSPVVYKTSASSIASFSTTEVCRRLLKEKNRQNEHDSSVQQHDPNDEGKQTVTAEKDKLVLLSSVLNTMQLPNQHVPSEGSADLTVSSSHTESFKEVGDTNYRNDLLQVSNQSLKTNNPLPAITQGQQTTPASPLISKSTSPQSVLHSDKNELSNELPTLIKYPSNKDSSITSDMPSSSSAGSDKSTKPVTGNTVNEVVDHKVFNNQHVANNTQSGSAQQPMQVDDSIVASESAVQNVQPLPSDQISEASSVTQFVANLPQSNDEERCQLLQLQKQFSFSDISASFISSEPSKLYRSQSVRDKSLLFMRRTTGGDCELPETQKVKKPYGKTHPLSRLSSTYMSRDCSMTVKDNTSGNDTT